VGDKSQTQLLLSSF